MESVDLIIEDNLTVFMLRPLTQSARDWLVHNLPGDATWWDNCAAVEAETLPQIMVDLANRRLTFRAPSQS